MPNIGEYIESVATNTVKLRMRLGGRLEENVEPGIGFGGQLKALDDMLDNMLDDITYCCGKSLGCCDCDCEFETAADVERHGRDTGHDTGYEE